MLRRMLKRSVTAVVLYRSARFMMQEMGRLKKARDKDALKAPRLEGAGSRPAPTPAVPHKPAAPKPATPKPAAPKPPPPKPAALEREAPAPTASKPAAPKSPPEPPPRPDKWVILTDPPLATAGSTIPLQTVLPVVRYVAGRAGGEQPEIVHTKDATAARVSGRLLLVNSISPLLLEQVRSAILRAVANNTASFENIFVYLHEEEYVFQRIRNEGKEAAIDFLSKVTVVPLTPELKAWYEQRYGWRCTSPVYNTTYFRPRSNSPFPGSKKHVNFLTVASLQTRKGVERLVAVAREAESQGLSHVHFHWVGPYGKLVTSDLPEAYPANFTWWGRLSPSHLQHLVPAFDCMVLPSYSDPLPLSLWEAALSGKRSIISNEVGTRALGFKDIFVPVDFEADAKEVLDRLLEVAGRSGEPLEPGEMARLSQMLRPESFYAALAAAIARPQLPPLDLGEASR